MTNKKEKAMFAAGDLVQPRVGGPKLKVVEVNGDQLVVVQASNEQSGTFTLKAVDVTPYTEEGDFGVC
jgi:uncharacterized protein YodC (DUF2158 family)